MLDKAKLRKKVLLGLLSSPLTLVPFMVGATLLGGALALSRRPGWLAFAGLACVLGAIGTFFTRLVLGNEKRTQKVVEELRTEALAEQERRLDELDGRLARDNDERTEAALRDLRAFERAFRARPTWPGKLNAASTFDIVASVQDLFDGCVKSLETSLELWETAGKLRSADARRPILARREEIIQDVQKSIAQLSRIMVGIQRLGAGEESDSGLSRIRAELDESLAVAKRVEEKMQDWQREALELE